MKTLVIDREDITAELMRARLEPLGHKITHEDVKNNAVDRLSEEDFDIIFLDPAPLTSAQPIILNLRRATRRHPYIVQMGECSLTEAIQCGANNAIGKPIDPQSLDDIVINARHLSAQIKRIDDKTQDFPSSGGIIAKSAFNELFLSAIDRASRYGERTYVVFISLQNYSDFYDNEGAYSADQHAAKLANYLVNLRRQSDIIAQTEQNEFALLLQRPLYETEPVEAANRFAEAIMSKHELFKTQGISPIFQIKLIDLPVGSQMVDHTITKDHISK